MLHTRQAGRLVLRTAFGACFCVLAPRHVGAIRRDGMSSRGNLTCRRLIRWSWRPGLARESFFFLLGDRRIRDRCAIPPCTSGGVVSSGSASSGSSGSAASPGSNASSPAPPALPSPPSRDAVRRSRRARRASPARFTTSWSSSVSFVMLSMSLRKDDAARKRFAMVEKATAPHARHQSRRGRFSFLS